MKRIKSVGFLLAGLVRLASIQAGLSLVTEDTPPPPLQLHNASDASPVRIVYATKDKKKFLFSDIKVEDGNIKAKLNENDGSQTAYTLTGSDTLSEQTFGNDPAQILMAAQPYNDTETTRVPMGGWLGKQGVKKPETRTITKYNAWTMPGTLIQEKGGLTYFFPKDWLPTNLSVSDNTYKVHFGLGGLDWTPLVSVGQPKHLEFKKRFGGDALSDAISTSNNFVRQAGGAEPLTPESGNLRSTWGTVNGDLLPLFEHEPYTNTPDDIVVNGLALD
jgi:hypothetical protein